VSMLQSPSVSLSGICVSHFVSLSQGLRLYFFVLSFSVNLSFCVCLSLCLSPSISGLVSMLQSPSVSLSGICVSHFVSLSLSLSLDVSRSICFSLCLSVFRVTLSLSTPAFICWSIPLVASSPFFSLCVSLSL